MYINTYNFAVFELLVFDIVIAQYFLDQSVYTT